MNRREFFRRSGMAAVAAAVAPYAQWLPMPVRPAITYGDISRSTYAYWRNQTLGPSTAPPLTLETFDKLWKECR